MDCNLMIHQIINASSLDAKKLSEMADAQNMLKNLISGRVMCSWSNV